MAKRRSLPEFVAPMLAQAGPAFDSDEHFFEIKWDGFRALLFVEESGYRLVSRRRVDLKPRYPELSAFARLPAGTVLDGEIVLLRGDRPDFHALLARDRRGTSDAARRQPVSYVAFDLLYADYQRCTAEPLETRRARLEGLVSEAQDPRLVFSQGVIGAGQAFFAAACERDLEGIVAKRRSSRYHPGRRTDAWIKIKRQQQLLCVILGFLPAGRDDLQSLLVATNFGSELRYVGRVGSGLTDDQRRDLAARLRQHPRPTPVVPCPEAGIWVEPVLYCTVSYVELTPNGMLRAPVFRGLAQEK